MDLPRDRPARWFYVAMGVAALLVVFVGFAPSFYLRSATLPPLPPLVVIHGVVFSGWVLLFITQTTLVATGRTPLHRRLGFVGAGLAILIVVLGPMVAIPAARRGALPGNPKAFLLVMLTDLVLFAVFVSAAIYHRTRSETHKRLMLLAMLSLLPPAISRWPIAGAPPLLIVGGMLVLVCAAPIRDVIITRHLHPVSVWGGLAVVASLPVRFALSQTAVWQSIATWLIN